jgi:hypothetical protein
MSVFVRGFMSVCADPLLDCVDDDVVAPDRLGADDADDAAEGVPDDEPDDVPDEPPGDAGDAGNDGDDDAEAGAEDRVAGDDGCADAGAEETAGCAVREWWTTVSTAMPPAAAAAVAPATRTILVARLAAASRPTNRDRGRWAMADVATTGLAR